MRIGIITIHHVTNYGAVFQAYALSRALAKRGADVEIIDYRPSIAVEWYRQRFWKNGRPNVARHLWHRSFDRFIARHLPLGPTRFATDEDLAAGSLPYDAIVAGSDQIWCTGDGSFRGFDPAFFLNFCRRSDVAKFSYAASAGNTQSFGEVEGIVSPLLKEFAAVSVRDDRTADLVRPYLEDPPTVVLDPVFVHDFDELVADVEPGNDLVVFGSQPARFAEIAQTIARKHGLRIVSLVKPLPGADATYRVLGPVQWLRLMKGARVVLTDYFHGLAISLKFGRPVLADAAPGKTAKIADLANRLDVSDLFLPHSTSALEALERAIVDPARFAAEIAERLEEPLDRSNAFLDSICASAGASLTVGAVQ